MSEEECVIKTDKWELWCDPELWREINAFHKCWFAQGKETVLSEWVETKRVKEISEK